MSELNRYGLREYHREDIFTDTTDEVRAADRFYIMEEADEVIANLEESHKKEVEQLLMKIAGLEKLVETADKIIKLKGGFTVKDVTFKGIKLEGMPSEPEV